MHLEAIKQLKLLTCDWTTQAREENITVDNVPVAEGEHSVSESWLSIQHARKHHYTLKPR